MYSPSNALCSADKSVQIKHFKHHTFIGTCSHFTWFNLQILNFCYRKNWVFYSFSINLQSKPKTFNTPFRSSHPEVFLVKGVLKICSKFAGEHPCESAISIKLQSNFIKITLWHWCSSVNFLLIFKTPFTKNTS